ncbi:MAG: lamin tail domain-containing protein [Candidatus Moraniibacteriota bacterium]
MKTKIITIHIAVFLYVFFSVSGTHAEALSPIIISEIQITGGAGHTNNEFVRLSAADSDPVTLTGFKLIQTKFSEKKSSCSDETLVPTSKFAAKSIPGNGSLLIAHPEYEGADVVDIFYAKSNTLTENTMRISLLDERDNLIARKDVGTRCEAEQQTDPIPPSVSDTPPATDFGIKTVRINEIFPNPSAKSDAGEFIELYNSGTEPADISGWTVRDATKAGKYIFPAGTIIAAAAYLSVTDQSFKLSLNNSNEIVSLFDNSDVLIDSVHYTTTKENVSLNYTPSGWRGGTPTPGAANILNTLPETKEKVPKKGFKNTPVTFSAKGKDVDGDTLKYTWDFGDGHKSYKRQASHAYAKNGTYAVTLKTTDGSDDILETFMIEIRSYKPPEVRITSLMPNPAGNDTDNEWIIIENRGKKEVNLKGFGIATGWKNLSNHPIREDFLIKPKKEAKLTRATSLFTLPNQKGKIELRAPDGKVLQKIKYELEKSVAENVAYRKKKGERWSVEATAEKESDTDTGDASPVPEEESAGEPATPDMDAPPAEEAPDSPETGGSVLGASTTADAQSYRYARNRQWLKLLNVGTRAHLPEHIVFVPHDRKTVPGAPLDTYHAATPFSITSFSDLNASLNGLLNGAR